MKSHVWRPLVVVLVIVGIILAARFVVVPDDFGIHEAGYMYGWYRGSNPAEWKNFPVKYRTSSYCAQCHVDKTENSDESKHGFIECENCHGPAMEHPENPQKLMIDPSRDLCLRCHAELPYPGSDRRHIPGVDAVEHYADMQCRECHDPHRPNLEEM